MKKKAKKITYANSGVNVAKAEKLIQDFLSEVRKHCNISIEEVVTTKEKVVFKLPKALN